VVAMLCVTMGTTVQALVNQIINNIALHFCK